MVNVSKRQELDQRAENRRKPPIGQPLQNNFSGLIKNKRCGMIARKTTFSQSSNDVDVSNLRQLFYFIKFINK